MNRKLSLWIVLVTACDQASSPVDASMLDAGGHDASVAVDARTADAGTPSDAGTEPLDAGPLADASTTSYSTNFDLDENPISEGGRWSHRATPWNVITTFLNGTMLQQVDVTSISGPVFSDGSPGIAFWRGTGASATPGDYGFTSFSAMGLP